MARDPHAHPIGGQPAARTPIVLASGSPRRRELLEGLGLSFAVRPADVDERPRSGEAPAGLVERLARAKAAAVADGAPDALVIAADTVVVVDGEILGKPADHHENRAFLDRLSGRGHEVVTGHCLRLGGRERVVTRTTHVAFRALSEDERARYVATGEGLDKAGGYAIQGRGAALVDRVDGCYFTVVGLSLASVAGAARELGVELV